MRSLLVFLVLVCLCPMARAGEKGSWPQFLGPTRDGVAENIPLSEKWGDAPATLWQKKVGQGFAGPAVTDGKVILFHRVKDREVVECLDLLTGANVWNGDYATVYSDDFGFDEGPRATPTISGDKVYTFGAEGSLNCWEFSSGKRLWTVETKEKYASDKGFFGRVCSPLVEGQAVILNLGGAKGAGIVAFDKDKGTELWRATTDDASYSSPVAATIHGKRFVFALTRAGLVCLQPADGKVVWSTPFRSRMNASVNAATPLAVGEQIFVSASYGTGAALLKFGEDKPQQIWANDESMSNHYATCVYHDGYLYGFDGRQEMGCNLRCVELSIGKVKWSEDGFGAGTLMRVGPWLLILREKGELVMAEASAEGFKPVNKAQILGFEVRAYPAMAGGIYLARDKEKLVAVDLRKK